MFLFEFSNNIKDDIDNFNLFWGEQNRKNSESFPFILNQEVWLEQFLVWRENK